MTENSINGISRVPIPTIDLEMTQHEEAQKMTFHDNQPDEPATAAEDHKPQIWKYLEKHWAVSSQSITLLIIFMMLWGVVASVLPHYAQPSSTIMRIIFLFVGAQICGTLVSFTGLPDMLGMLFWGVFYTNVGWGDFEGYGGLEAVLREMALVNIMLLAGLGLDLGALKKLFGIIMRVTIVPTICEVAVITVCSFYFLKMPWLWGILLGLVITAISPNVVITVLLKLQEERLGMTKGLHTVIIAMTSCNDIIAIFFFGVLLGIIFATGNLTQQLLQGPVGIALGIAFGGVAGMVLLKFPSNLSKYSNGLRFSTIVVAGALSVLGSKYIKYPSAGALGCITTAFVAGTGWRRRKEKDRNYSNEVAMYLDLLWKFLKPVSFSLIGKEVDFSVLEGNMVLYGLLTLVAGVAIRLLSTYMSSFGGDMNWKERVYITISGFPKATVQAALGPVALDLARSLKSEENYAMANTILVISVLAIILTAPLGAILMIKLAPKMLKRQSSSEEVNV